jgi:hypothetical protein
MTAMDRITEEISHFIGMFHMSVEQTRMREAYNEFTPRPDNPSDPDIPEWAPSKFQAPYGLIGYDPGVDYVPPGFEIEKVTPWMPLKFKFLKVPDMEPPYFGSPAKLLSGFAPGLTITMTLPQIDPPGSIANYIHQVIYLSDNDYFGVGGNGLLFSPELIGNSELLHFAEAAMQLSPLGNMELPGSAEALKDFITSVSDALDAYTYDPDSPAEIFVHKADSIEGIYVNGELVDAVPDIDAYISLDDDDDTGTDDVVHVASVKVTHDGHSVVEASVDIDTGSNTLINNAVLTNLWTGGKVTVVNGDHIELNVIIQINAIYDANALSTTLNGWTVDDAANQYFNIASFKHTNPLDNNDDGSAAAPGFPTNWIVTEIKGDLLIVNWMEQFIFRSDNDVGIVSSSGVKTEIIAGDNLGVNHVSIYELAYAYDIIIIGGSWYDANIIEQMNVLMDNDLVGTLDGFQTSGEGSVSASDNLLWNQALIYNVGGDISEMPAHYQQLANNLAAGNNTLPAGALSDPTLAGAETLRVLYVEGDLINLNYIKQTNIIGDSDQIALAMNEFQPRADAEWTITTGSNALLNNAAIVDLDSLGPTYVGGEQYSQAMLVQAELISDKPEFWARDPDALVNEAVAFLDDSLDDGADATPTYYAPDGDAPQGDGLQTMLG